MNKQRIITFLKSLWFHISLGMPKSSQKVIDYRLSICLQCPHFNTSKKECYICGCNINNKKQFLNKLAWADQECPDGRWGKEI